MKRNTFYSSLYLVILILVAVTIFASCESASGKRAMGIPIDRHHPSPTPTVRVKSMEDGTINYAILTFEQKRVLKYLDTVHVNFATHSVENEASEFTKRCVIYMK